MNSSFLQDIFASDDFRRDYAEYLGSFDGVMKKENDKKLEKFIIFILESIEKKKTNVSLLPLFKYNFQYMIQKKLFRTERKRGFLCYRDNIFCWLFLKNQSICFFKNIL